MAEQEELLKLRALLEEKERIIEKQTSKIEKQEKLIEKQRIQIDNMIQALLHARKKIFGASSEKSQLDGQLNLFESVQELAEELFKEQKKITVKSYERSPRKPGVREEMLAGIPKRLKSMLSIHKRIVQSVEEPYGSLGKKSFAQKWNSFQQN